MSNAVKDLKKAAANQDKWASLSRFTQARIGLGRAGSSLPTHVQLKFNADHALARDAVKTPLDTTKLIADIQDKTLNYMCLHSQANNRQTYLQRPDLGRKLNEKSIESLTNMPRTGASKFDVAIVLVDGLSSTAVQQHGANLVKHLDIAIEKAGLSRSPIMIVEQGRVAIGDQIGELLNARAVLLIVGERPGLSSPDSLGIYYTYAPKTGLKDDSRNCISNIRPAGLSIEAATEKALWLIQQSFLKKLSGVKLKDLSNENSQALSTNNRNFLTPKT